MTDLFNCIETLPVEVQKILNSYDENKGDYQELERMNNELSTYGYTFDYYLDAIPSNLRIIQDVKEHQLANLQIIHLKIKCLWYFFTFYSLFLLSVLRWFLETNFLTIFSSKISRAMVERLSRFL